MHIYGTDISRIFIPPYDIQQIFSAVNFIRIKHQKFKKIKLSDYTKQTFGMYSGELQSVTMRFPNNMVGTVLDRFGREVTLMKADDRHFRITVPIAVSPQFYGWVFGLKNMVTIESPQSVVDGMKEMLAAVEKRYEDSKGSQ